MSVALTLDLTQTHTYRYDWHAAHFGYPGRVKLHTAWYGDLFIRIFRSNPNIVDGKIVDSRQGSTDVLFRVDSAVRNKVLEAIERDLSALDAQAKIVQGLNESNPF